MRIAGSIPIHSCAGRAGYSLSSSMKTVILLMIGFFAGFGSFAADSKGLPRARATAEGFSPERLERLHQIVNDFVESGQHAGIVTLLARDGKIVDTGAYGYADVEKKIPMRQ